MHQNPTVWHVIAGWVDDVALLPASLACPYSRSTHDAAQEYDAVFAHVLHDHYSAPAGLDFGQW